jgi:hypothetical protein
VADVLPAAGPARADRYCGSADADTDVDVLAPGYAEGVTHGGRAVTGQPA